MFGIGFFEFLLILLGLLLFIKPEDLPKFVYRLGKVYGALQQAYTNFRRELHSLSHQVETAMRLESPPPEKDQLPLHQPVNTLPKAAPAAKKKSIPKKALPAKKRSRSAPGGAAAEFPVLKRSLKHAKRSGGT